MSKTIGQLDAGSALDGSEKLEMEQSGASKRTTVGAFSLLPSSPASDMTGYGRQFSMVAGASISTAQACYIDATGRLALAQAATAGTVLAIGLAAESAGVGSSLTMFSGPSIFRSDAWNWTSGGTIYLSASTAGSITQTRPSTTGQNVYVCGVAKTSDIILFAPSMVYVEV